MQNNKKLELPIQVSDKELELLIEYAVNGKSLIVEFGGKIKNVPSNLWTLDILKTVRK